MNWKLLFARDGALWQVFFCGGLIVLTLSATPQSILDTFPVWVTTAMPTIRLLALIATVLGGKFGMSPAPLARNMEGGNK
jgi:hypothetical protein